ncbi:MAG: hypothetical protein Q9209_002964 [Squamulea sp. 1 TL-2023]
MAGASDKARFYLEKSVPELQELIQKKIFTKDEVSSVAKKRSGFEHKLNARGSTASDYARYAEYEMNLDALRRTRAKRLGIKTTSYTGQRRIFFVLDRATRKFHGDTALWMLYLSFARKQKANKKVAQIITSMLRLQPTNPDLWIYAANYAWEERADVTETRGYMQRGLRFCSNSKNLWSEYLKLEMIYIAKILARRRILGLNSDPLQRASIQDDDDFGQDLITLPPVTSEDIGSENTIAESIRPMMTKGKDASTQALAGAIPIAIFDAAMKRFPEDPTFGAQLFDCVAAFHELGCVKRILQHMVRFLMRATSTDAVTLKCFIHEPLVGVTAASTLLPKALVEVLDRFQLAMQKIDSLKGPLQQITIRGIVSRHTILWIVTYLEYLELDPDIRAVLSAMLKTAWGHCLQSLETRSTTSGDETIALLDTLHLHGFKDLVQQGVTSALTFWPDEPRLLALRNEVTKLNPTQ